MFDFKKVKEIYLPISLFLVSAVFFVYLQYVEPSESVEKKITLKASHDPKVYLDEKLKQPKSCEGTYFGLAHASSGAKSVETSGPTPGRTAIHRQW